MSVPQINFRKESWSGKKKPLLFSDCSHTFSFNKYEKKLHIKKWNITFFRERDMTGNAFFLFRN